jgi:hypothetical protein
MCGNCNSDAQWRPRLKQTCSGYSSPLDVTASVSPEESSRESGYPGGRDPNRPANRVIHKRGVIWFVKDDRESQYTRESYDTAFRSKAIARLRYTTAASCGITFYYFSFNVGLRGSRRWRSQCCRRGRPAPVVAERCPSPFVEASSHGALPLVCRSAGRLSSRRWRARCCRRGRPAHDIKTQRPCSFGYPPGLADDSHECVPAQLLCSTRWWLPARAPSRSLPKVVARIRILSAFGSRHPRMIRRLCTKSRLTPAQSSFAPDKPFRTSTPRSIRELQVLHLEDAIGRAATCFQETYSQVLKSLTDRLSRSDVRLPGLQAAAPASGRLTCRQLQARYTNRPSCTWDERWFHHWWGGKLHRSARNFQRRTAAGKHLSLAPRP